MTSRRLFLDRLLLSGAIFMALLSLIMLVSTIQSVRETSQGFRGNLMFYAAQLENETAQLMDRIHRFQDNDETVEARHVILRFDILWSRVNNASQQRVFLENADEVPLAATTLEIARDLLNKLESPILELDRADHETINFLIVELRGFLAVAHRLMLAAKDNRAENEAAYLSRQLRQSYLTFAFILGMVFFGALSTVLLRADRREIHSMNTRLEERVRARTQELQSANALLAAEVAERERSQTIAAEREARLEQAAQLAGLGHYVWNAEDEECEFCSEQHAAAFGVSAKEFIKTTAELGTVSDLVHPSDQQMLQSQYQKVRSGQIVVSEYRTISREGTKRIREIARPILDENGDVFRVIASSLDVTEKHETELKLFEAQKMDSIGKLTGGVAHDFNNLLAVIMGNLELLREMPESEEREEMIEDAIAATHRGRDLTMSMLSFARRAPIDPTELNLNIVVSEMLGMLSRTLPENITLTVELDDDINTITADRSLTESALLNLALNARDAMPDGGSLHIRTKNHQLDDGHVAELEDEIEPGDYVGLSVADTGHGVSDELRDRIFEPFFSTKGIAQNSGLGLSMAHGYMRQTGGAIKMTSTQGKGAEFELLFKTTASAQAIKPPKPLDDLLNSGKRIKVLVVEDEWVVRKALSRQLECHGAEVVAASDSAAAEDAFRAHGPFDIVISDVVMPGELQGPALVKKLRKTQQGLPAIFLSGYHQDQITFASTADDNDAMLMKPVGWEELSVAINSALRAKLAAE